MLQQFEPVAEPVVADGEKREGAQGEQGADQGEPVAGIGPAAQLVEQGAGEEDEGERLEGRGHGQRGIGDVGRIQADGGEVLLELGKPVAADPQEMGAADRLVDQVEEPENRPVQQDGIAQQLLGRPGLEEGVVHVGCAAFKVLSELCGLWVRPRRSQQAGGERRRVSRWTAVGIHQGLHHQHNLSELELCQSFVHGWR